MGKKTGYAINDPVGGSNNNIMLHSYGMPIPSVIVLPVTYLRNGKENTVIVTLKNKAGTFELVKPDAAIDALGADLITLDARKAREYGVPGGVVVKKINEGALNDQTRMKDGFVILKVNDKTIKSIEEMKTVIGTQKNITISGFYPGYDGVYEYPINLGDQ